MLISVCLLSYNRPDFLLRSVRTMLENADNPFELLVHDDASTNPQVKEVLDRLFADKKISTLIYNNGQNKGVGYAVDYMFKIARGDLLMKADQDLEYEKGWDTVVKKAFGVIARIGAMGLFHYQHDPVDHRKMFVKDLGNGYEIVKDFVGSAFITTRELYEKYGVEKGSTAFAEDVGYKQKLVKAGYGLVLPKDDIARNFGFGPPNSTVVYQEGEEIKVTLIHPEPLLVGGKNV